MLNVNLNQDTTQKNTQEEMHEDIINLNKCECLNSQKNKDNEDNKDNQDNKDNKDNQNEWNNLCLGIDFGTTNSCLSVWYKNKSIIIPDIDGGDIIPTIIEINTDKKVIGKQAYLRKEIFDSDKVISKKTIFLVYEIKKLLGKKYSDLKQKQIEMLAYDVKPDPDDNILIIDSTTSKAYYPEEIATHLFMSFKLKAEMFLTKHFNSPTQIQITNSVISVPAYFNKNQRQNIKNAAEYAGLRALRLINEPTAAAICYGLGKYSSGENGINIIVFDFGGGTLDVSLLNINDGVYEVLSSCGNNDLGGSDFDTTIMEYVVGEFVSSNKLDEEKFKQNVSENSLQKLKFLCEQAKIALSENTNTKIKISDFYNEIELAVSLSREKFNEICQGLIRLIVKPISNVLELAELEKEDVSEIIMVGGMTRVPIVRFSVERFFNKDVNCSINPDNVVSIGASIQGHLLVNGDNIKDKLLLIDRTSLSIGVETSGGIMDVLVPRGTIIPVRKTKKYSTDEDYVDSIDIKIYEGERKFTKDNFLVGDFVLSGIEKQKKGIPSIQITFAIDSDGIVKIFAEDLDNPLNKKSIQVSGNKQNLTKEQIEEIIENAKEMDQSDKIDKTKKESYMTICDNSKKILDNISGDYIKIPENIKQQILSNVNEIYDWIKSHDYQEIEIDKYKEILHDYKVNYSIYILQQTAPIIDLEASNAKDEKDKGIEIYDDEDADIKKYGEQIDYFKKIIDEYDNIRKQINIAKFTNQKKINSLETNLPETNSPEANSLETNFNELQAKFDVVFTYASDTLLQFYLNKKLAEEYVNDIVNKMYELDVEFKEMFNTFDKEFNIITKLITKLEDKEESYLSNLEYLETKYAKLKLKKFKKSSGKNLKLKSKSNKKHNKKNNKVYSNSQNLLGANLKKKINSINNNLDIIIEFQGVIHKMNSGYVESDMNKLSHMLECVNKLD